MKMFGNAEAYERFMGRWSRLLAPLLVNFSEVQDMGQVLDVGSGTGALALSIAKSKIHCQVSGIDPSKEYVEFANSRNPFPDRVSFQLGDATQLRFSDATFQASLSLLAFNFIPDSRKALREVSRVTKPGGCCLTHLPCNDIPSGILSSNVPFYVQHTLFPPFATIQRISFSRNRAFVRCD